MTFDDYVLGGTYAFQDVPVTMNLKSVEVLREANEKLHNQGVGAPLETNVASQHFFVNGPGNELAVAIDEVIR